MARPAPPTNRPERPPLSTPVKAVVLLVLALTGVAIVADRRRVRTGELLVQADGAGVRVAIHREGRVVVPPTDRRSFTLPPGEYEVTPEVPPPAPHAVPPRVTIKKGGRAVVRIETP